MQQAWSLPVHHQRLVTGGHRVWPGEESTGWGPHRSFKASSSLVSVWNYDNLWCTDVDLMQKLDQKQFNIDQPFQEDSQCLLMSRHGWRVLHFSSVLDLQRFATVNKHSILSHPFPDLTANDAVEVWRSSPNSLSAHSQTEHPGYPRFHRCASILVKIEQVLNPQMVACCLDDLLLLVPEKEQEVGWRTNEELMKVRID